MTAARNDGAVLISSEAPLYSSVYASTESPAAIKEHRFNPLSDGASVPNHSAVQIPHRCLWNGCTSTFATAEELVSHVNSAHLWWAAQNPVESAFGSVEDMACMWDHCKSFPDINSIPSTSSNGTSHQPLASLLSQHLIHDHLGLLARTDTANTGDSQQSVPSDEPVPSNLSSSTDQEPPCMLSHLCQWEGCYKAFLGCTELHEHLISEHVGSGKAQYDCHWTSCPRHEDKAFASKQKILRHLQVSYNMRFKRFWLHTVVLNLVAHWASPFSMQSMRTVLLRDSHAPTTLATAYIRKWVSNVPHSHYKHFDRHARALCLRISGLRQVVHCQGCPHYSSENP